MKKLLLSLGVFASFAVSAQIDTIANHFVLGQLGPTLPPSGAGWVAGNNDYSDLSKMQLFDAAYGVTGPGTITNVLLSIPVKDQTGGGSFSVKLWADNAGTPSTELGSVTLQMAQVDTSSAAMFFGTDFLYNVNTTFNVAVPANGKFWAGVVLPTTAGDTIAILTSDTLFTDALTHTGEFWSDNTFHTFGDPANWGLNVSLGVFPVVNFGGNGISENELGAVVYPNPANNTLNFKLNSNAVSFDVVTMDGKNVLSNEFNSAVGSIDISSLEAGMYMYVITTEKGAKATSTFVKK